jgi:hypothetical protein
MTYMLYQTAFFCTDLTSESKGTSEIEGGNLAKVPD